MDCTGRVGEMGTFGGLLAAPQRQVENHIEAMYEALAAGDCRSAKKHQNRIAESVVTLAFQQWIDELPRSERDAFGETLRRATKLYKTTCKIPKGVTLQGLSKRWKRRR